MRARKRFGQHFLQPAWVDKVVDAIDPRPTDRFVEIGPGRGAITTILASRIERLVAIEVDRDLAALLARQAPANVTVVTADVLDVTLADIAGRELGATRANPIRIAGNLPYSISSPILFRLLETGASRLASDATLMLQKEVADRLVAAPATAEYGVLTLTTALDADVTRLLSLPAGAFRPVPKVQSALVRLSFRPPPDYVTDRSLVTSLIRAVFTQRRKMLGNALEPFASSRGASARVLLDHAGIDPRRRPETLRLDEVARLAAGLRTR